MSEVAHSEPLTQHHHQTSLNPLSDVTVVKYGGMCLATPERIRDVATSLSKRILNGERLVIVVSAMGKSTDQLIQLAHSVSQSPDRRELDMLISTGERVSMALVSMALNDALKDNGSDLRSISLTGSQAGVLTSEVHSQARIVAIRAGRLEAALQSGTTVILAGFQGVSESTKEITTLGRGGSDLTAVAMAVALGARQCEIVKEVPGVMSDDPARFPQAVLLPELDYQTLCSMTYWGAKVLHRRAADVAMQNKLQLVVRKVGADRGTHVKFERKAATLTPSDKRGLKMSQASIERTPVQLIATTEQRSVRKFIFHSPESMQATMGLSELLNQNGIVDLQVVMTQVGPDHVAIFAWGDADLLTSATQVISQKHSNWSLDPGLFATTTFHFDGLVTAEANAIAMQNWMQRLQMLSSQVPPIVGSLTGPHSVTILHAQT